MSAGVHLHSRLCHRSNICEAFGAAVRRDRRALRSSSSGRCASGRCGGRRQGGLLAPGEQLGGGRRARTAGARGGDVSRPAHHHSTTRRVASWSPRPAEASNVRRARDRSLPGAHLRHATSRSCGHPCVSTQMSAAAWVLPIMLVWNSLVLRRIAHGVRVSNSWTKPPSTLSTNPKFSICMIALMRFPPFTSIISIATSSEQPVRALMNFTSPREK